MDLDDREHHTYIRDLNIHNHSEKQIRFGCHFEIHKGGHKKEVCSC